MCGIFGIIHKTEEVSSKLLEGLKISQNRGYDSAGIITTHQNEFNLIKYASTNEIMAIDKLGLHIDSCKGKIGIGHTRWATHGSKTNANSHPH